MPVENNIFILYFVPRLADIFLEIQIFWQVCPTLYCSHILQQFIYQMHRGYAILKHQWPNFQKISMCAATLSQEHSWSEKRYTIQFLSALNSGR